MVSVGLEGAARLLNLQPLRDWLAQRSSWVRSFHRAGFTESGFYLLEEIIWGWRGNGLVLSCFPEDFRMRALTFQGGAWIFGQTSDLVYTYCVARSRWM
ncbi:hypothetical protein I7I50_12484 [Histoplasma capsulatum G186AR]|uniref:Uncharacterized protein n=1 Tax=Ajellomyces capsulatus TaxID=5037 RepID=A0A8H7YCJ1_AJECA|nr:hypothetical protein I7I52_11209 [Histoplasma capsulatum]QSS70750.1 hypothetical protein I7I50_12484 [Histoplasma capsulatum G186AR]